MQTIKKAGKGKYRNHSSRVDVNRQTDKEWGNNTGLNTHQTNEGMRCRWRDAGNRSVLTRLMWDVCVSVGGDQTGEEHQEHRRETEHWEHRWAGSRKQEATARHWMIQLQNETGGNWPKPKPWQDVVCPTFVWMTACTLRWHGLHKSVQNVMTRVIPAWFYSVPQRFLLGFFSL